MNKKKIKRYHREIFFPDWAEESLKTYVKGVLSKTPLTYSIHALDKAINYAMNYGRIALLDALKSVYLESDKVFEFYAVKEEIKKTCFRFSPETLPVDIVMVISADGVVITMYVINQGDNHTTLDKRLYERNAK